MKRWAFVLGALAIGMAAFSRQAEASYSIIRWTSGFLSGLGQFNSLEAISPRLHSRANTLQNF